VGFAAEAAEAAAAAAAAAAEFTAATAGAGNCVDESAVLIVESRLEPGTLPEAALCKEADVSAPVAELPVSDPPPHAVSNTEAQDKVTRDKR